MTSLAQWGNELYTGKRSYPFVQKWRLWFAIAALLLLVSGGLTLMRGGFNFGIEFRGGSEFTVSGVENTDPSFGQQAMSEAAPESESTVTNIAPGTMRVQTEQLDDQQTLAVGDRLQEAYGVGEDQVTSNFIGPTWGEAVSQQALLGLIIFVVLVALLMAVYFRTWKMSLAAVIGLLYVVALSAGIYGAVGFEITPSAIIGFLTILSYALYDTVVVFDKIRENTETSLEDSRRTFAENVLGEGPAGVLQGGLGVLPDLVEHHHGVVERVGEDGQEADDRRRGDLEPDRTVDAGRERHHVQQADHRGQRHLPGAEVHGHQQGHEDHEDDQAQQRLLGDGLAPGGTDEVRGDLVLADPVRLLQAVADGQGLLIVQLLGLHAHGARSDVRDRGLGLRSGLGHGLLAERGVGVLHTGHRELGAAAELDAEVEPAAHQGQPAADEQQQRGDGEPEPPLLDERVGALSGVELVAPLCQ